MNRIAGRLWVKVFVKAHIRAVWNKLNNMTDYDDPSSAFESLIRLTSTDSSYCDLLGVMVDTISAESPMASWFLYHIIDLAALPSQHTIRRLSQELLSKCSPGGLARLRTRKRCRPTAALVWGVLASRLAGELSSVLFSDEVRDCLLNNIECDPDMICKVFSIIALEKFALTGPCKIRIMQRPIQSILRDVASMSIFGLTNQEEIAGIRQAKFCAEWALRRVFYDMPAEPRRSIFSGSGSPAQDSAIKFSTPMSSTTGSESTSNTVSEKSLPPKASHINVMLNITEASRYWKVSEDGLMVRNDGSSFESIRATVSVTCGKWYYEVTLLTSGIMQLGWGTPQCRFCPDEGTGVGDDLFGFSYDGCRNLLWANGESTHYGDGGAWRPGDVLGFYLDIDNAQLECFINGVSLGTMTPFASADHFQDQAAAGYFPAFSITPLQQIELNFGASPFRYPPARPWRNLNDHGTLTPELREAITKTTVDDLATKLRLDPETGLRVAIVTDQVIDYSSLCSICCDHAATITLQPCGHDGFCVQCAYALDLCPMCRTRIFQRQMVPKSSEFTEASGSATPSTTVTESGSGPESSGLCITGVSESFSVPVLNAQGDIVCSESSLQVPSDRPLTAADAAAHRLSQRRRTVATLGAFPSSSSCSAIAGNGSTSSLNPGEPRETARSTNDAFSPPSTSYFRFLSRPGARTRATGVHPFALENSSATNPSESLTSTSNVSPAANVAALSNAFPSRGRSTSVSGGLSAHDDNAPHPRLGPLAPFDPSSLPPSPPTNSSQVPIRAMPVEEHPDEERAEIGEMEQEETLQGHGLGLEDSANHPNDASPRSLSSLDSFGSGREASLDEVMERGVPDFPDASALPSHRASVSASMTSFTNAVGAAAVRASSNSNSGSLGTSSTAGIPLQLQDALPLPPPAQRPLAQLLPSQHAFLNTLSPSMSTFSSAPIAFPSGHTHIHHQHAASGPASLSISRRSSLADDMRLLLQQQGILPAQPPQSPMIESEAALRLHGGNARGLFEPSTEEADGASRGTSSSLEQRAGGISLQQDAGAASDSLSPLPSSTSFASGFSIAPGQGTSRTNGRRASLPANRLEI